MIDLVAIPRPCPSSLPVTFTTEHDASMVPEPDPPDGCPAGSSMLVFAHEAKSRGRRNDMMCLCFISSSFFCCRLFHLASYDPACSHVGCVVLIDDVRVTGGIFPLPPDFPHGFACKRSRGRYSVIRTREFPDIPQRSAVREPDSA